MARSLRFALLGALIAAAWAQPAHASRLVLEETMTTQHFQVHYDGVGIEGGIVHQDAGDLAALLERSYTLFMTELGYPAPLDDGDGRIDVFVVDLSTVAALGAALSDNIAALQASGYLYIDDGSVQSAETVAHELFHLIQIGQWQPMDKFVMEGTAEWAGFRFVNFPLAVDVGDDEPVPLSETLGAPDMSLTCRGFACGFSGYENGGYSRWHFYQYLTERFGGQPVKELFAKAKALNDATLLGGDILTAYLLGKGTTIGNIFGDWSVANMNGNYTAPGLKGIQPLPYSSTLTGSDTGALAAQKIAVNHLATRYVGFERGSANATGPCHAATLNVSVSLPSGVGSRPFFHWTMPGGTPIPLSISGTTASVSVPWDTCQWQYAGFVSLPNPSLAVDAAIFTVNATITVDKSRLATSTPPPAGSYTGPTVPASADDEAPTIALYGPETLRVSRTKRVLRLVVFSSGDGKLDTQLGALDLGTRTLRAGSNDLRFTLPKTALRSLAATNTLTVTALSTGGARGASVSRKLLLTK
jgi:hypothetical protein